MQVETSAPNRIDLAGGTTDLYPLFLFMDGGCTVNAAVSIYSRVRLRTRENGSVRVISEDLGKSVEAPTPADLPLSGPLALVCRAVRALPPPSGLEVTTRNEAPAGSGLGASSALLVALVAGLLRIRSEKEQAPALIALSANIEAATIGVPAGTQDHIAAYYGGVSVIEFGYRGYARRPSGLGPDALRRLEETTVLSYTDEGRFSGMNNWDVTKGYIDGQDQVREKLVGIRDVARAMSSSLEAGAWDDLSRLLEREWALRRSLAAGVSTPAIEAVMAAARQAGAWAGKICGAGGGGCMITLTPPAKRPAVERAIEGAGGRLMPFRVDFEGLTMKVTEP